MGPPGAAPDPFREAARAIRVLETISRRPVLYAEGVIGPHMEPHAWLVTADHGALIEVSPARMDGDPPRGYWPLATLPAADVLARLESGPGTLPVHTDEEFAALGERVVGELEA